jgi:uncharacterized protein YbjT (DUF2867 family)
LQNRGIPFRIGSRSAEPAFDWEQEATWAGALEGIQAAYIAYHPDLAVPAAAEHIQKFVDLAAASGVERLVLLSGRGEPEAQRCEEIVQQSGVEWTILRASWFFQNFSENFLLDAVLSGEVYLPAGEVKEPFIDAEDIADVAVAALTGDGHAGQLYELTGPQLLTFPEAVAEISQASGRQILYTQVPIAAYVAALEAQQVPADMVWIVQYLFTTVLDGRNASVVDGVSAPWGERRAISRRMPGHGGAGVWNGSNSPHPLPNTILVAYASRGGSTAGVAEAIGATLAASGLEVEVRPMHAVDDLAPLPRSGRWQRSPKGALVARSAAVHAAPSNRAAPEAVRRLSGVHGAGDGECAAPRAGGAADSGGLAARADLVSPVSEGLFAGMLDVSKIPQRSFRLAFRLSIALGFLGRRRYRDWEAIRRWANVCL